MLVWVTRDEPVDGPLSSALRRRGLEVVLEPVVTRRPACGTGFKPVPQMLARLTPDDWLVLTSPYAIEAVAGYAAARVPQVAVVGESSRVLAEKCGLRVALVSHDGHGRTLFEQLRQKVKRGVVCYPRSSEAESPAAWADVELRAPVLYETVAREFDRKRVQQADIAAVASPSAVEAMGGMKIPLASIGRTTSEAIRRHGREPAVEAARSTFDDLAAAIADYFASDSRYQRA